MSAEDLRLLRELLKRMIENVAMNRNDVECAMSTLQFISDEITYLSHQ